MWSSTTREIKSVAALQPCFGAVAVGKPTGLGRIRGKLFRPLRVLLRMRCEYAASGKGASVLGLNWRMLRWSWRTCLSVRPRRNHILPHSRMMLKIELCCEQMPVRSENHLQTPFPAGAANRTAAGIRLHEMAVPAASGGSCIQEARHRGELSPPREKRPLTAFEQMRLEILLCSKIAYVGSKSGTWYACSARHEIIKMSQESRH
jgi:hypothetical protein